MNIKTFRFFRVSILGSILSLIVLGGVCFAEPGVKIVEPLDGSVFAPGEEVTVRVETVDGFVIEELLVGAPHFSEIISTAPFVMSFTIPDDAIGPILVTALGRSPSKQFVTDEITINVQPDATLQSLNVSPPRLFLEKGYGSRQLNAEGMYSDGIERNLRSADIGTTYVSNDTEVVTVDAGGVVSIQGIGETTLTVSNSGVSTDVPVIVNKKWRSLADKDTIPPTTQINIAPSSNEAGWHNNDITVTLTATDDEDGTGVKEIHYILTGAGTSGETVPGDTAGVTISTEGILTLTYYAVDNKDNAEPENSVELKLDKTPPQVNITADPEILWPPKRKMIDVTVAGEAIDNLSGIASALFTVEDEYGKIEPEISDFNAVIQLEAWRKGNDRDGRRYTISGVIKDKADNTSAATATVTVPHDQRK